MASGIKLIENRPRSMIKREDFGKPFALHASREIDESVYDRIREIAPELRRSTEDAYRGAPWYRRGDRRSREYAERFARLPTRPTASPLVFGPVGYVLRDVRALAKPVPCRGWQSFWTLTPDLERQVAAQPARPA